MKVAVDMSVLGATAANAHQRHVFGVSRVALETVQALLHANSEIEELFLLARQCIASNEHYFEAIFAPTLTACAHFVPPVIPRPLRRISLRLEQYLSANYVNPPWKYFGTGRALWWAVRQLLDRIDPAIEKRLDIYHSVLGGFPRWTTKSSSLRRFMTVYDLICTIHPQHFPASAVAAARRSLAELTRNDWTLSISQSTRNDLLKYFPKVDPAKALVVSLAADRRFFPQRDLGKISAVRARYKIPEGPYFLSLCTVEPRKNVDVIIRGFSRFCEQEGLQREVSLVLVGKVFSSSAFLVAALEKAGSLRDRIVFTGFVEDDDLPSLYSGAKAFIYMSQYEGFGLPPLEAMQCGLPVIVSNSSSIPEVVGDAGILLDPADFEGVSAQMALLLRDEQRWRSLSAAGIARARHFSWEAFGKQTLGAYRAAVGG